MTIDRFDGTKYRFLSNFWPSIVCFEGDWYPTVEHAYQAAKTTEKELRRAIAIAKTPYIAKRLGNALVLRDNWVNLKYSVMEDLVRQKFAIPALQEMLLATGDEELIEGNTWGDVYWGVCDGKGQNNLGRILMFVRNYYRR